MVRNYDALNIIIYIYIRNLIMRPREEYMIQRLYIIGSSRKNAKRLIETLPHHNSTNHHRDGRIIVVIMYNHYAATDYQRTFSAVVVLYYTRTFPAAPSPIIPLPWLSHPVIDTALVILFFIFIQVPMIMLHVFYLQCVIVGTPIYCALSYSKVIAGYCRDLELLYYY